MIQEASSPTPAPQQVQLPRRLGQVTQRFVQSGKPSRMETAPPLDFPVQTTLSMLSIQLDATNVLWISQDAFLDLGSDTSDTNPAAELSAG